MFFLLYFKRYFTQETRQPIVRVDSFNVENILGTDGSFFSIGITELNYYYYHHCYYYYVMQSFIK